MSDFPHNDTDFEEIELYGANAADWLSRWDSGRHVWSIEMGGLGPGYEQCIQITAAEILRHLLDTKYDPALWSDKEVWQCDCDLIEKACFTKKAIKDLGLSGAQWGAGMSLATCLYRRGPREIMNDKAVSDRKIQVSKQFPGSRSI